MIDFSKITKTLDGYDCHYFGTRIGADKKVLYCFAVWTHNGVFEKCYDYQGRHLVWEPNVIEWKVCESNAFAIIKPPKIVEVTRWFRFERRDEYRDGFYVEVHIDKPGTTRRTLHIEQHTFRFEVPHE